MGKIEEILSGLEDLERKYFPSDFLERNKNPSEDKIPRFRFAEPPLFEKGGLEKEAEEALLSERERYLYRRETALLKEEARIFRKALDEKTDEYDRSREEYLQNNRILLSELSRAGEEINSLRMFQEKEREMFLQNLAARDRTIERLMEEISSLSSQFGSLSARTEEVMLHGSPVTEKERERIRQEERNIFLLELSGEKEEFARLLSASKIELKKEILSVSADMNLRQSREWTDTVQKLISGIAASVRRQREILSAVLGGIKPFEMKPEAAAQIRIIEEILPEFDGIFSSLDRISSLSVRKKSVDITGVLKVVIAGFEAKRAQNSTELVLEASGPLVSFTDAALISRAVSNIISNALDAVSEVTTGRITIEPEEKMISEDGLPEYRITVQDNGPGISDAARPYIFTPFYSDKKGYAGLGLFEARVIMLALGGEISVVSRNMSGTEVTLTWR